MRRDSEKERVSGLGDRVSGLGSQVSGPKDKRNFYSKIFFLPYTLFPIPDTPSVGAGGRKNVNRRKRRTSQ